MLARRSIVAARVAPGVVVSNGSASGSTLGAQRGMATLRELETRLKSVRNIEKITKSMKMIASTKLAKAQRAMTQAKSYGIANAEISTHTPTLIAGEEQKKLKRLFIAISSDKGLCGGIHSSVSKAVRRAFAGTPILEGGPILPTDPETSRVVVVGDKSKAQLFRALPGALGLTFSQIGRDIPTFADAAGVADIVLSTDLGTGSKGIESFESIVVVYNKFVSSIAYEAGYVEVRNEKGLVDSSGFPQYETDDTVTSDIAEFTLANAIYAALVEGHACEMSSRRNAMDNASKNAGDMIGALQLQYNRGRQAAITNELVDIITGASAL